MKRSRKRWVGGLALAAGALGAAGAFLMKKKRTAGSSGKGRAARGTSVWARPGMSVTFRAELMPGRERSERTFRVAELLASGRVRLEDFAGEHNEKEFEPLR